jgi:hypothetical protein
MGVEGVIWKATSVIMCYNHLSLFTFSSVMLYKPVALMYISYLIDRHAFQFSTGQGRKKDPWG